MGGAMESSSFAHGVFSDAVESCELLLPNGTVAVASRSTASDACASCKAASASLPVAARASRVVAEGEISRDGVLIFSRGKRGGA